MRVARAPRGATVGATAGLVVAGAFWAFGLSVGGEVPHIGLLAVVLTTLFVSVVPGWILGRRLGPGHSATVAGTFGYAVLAWVLWIPIAVLGSTWMDVQNGSLVGAGDILTAMVSQLIYAAVASLVYWMLALPFAIVWMAAFRAIGRISFPVPA